VIRHRRSPAVTGKERGAPVNPYAPGDTWNLCGVTCSGGMIETGGWRWGKNVGDRAPVPLGGEEVVEKLLGGVRRLGVGSIGIGEDRRGVSHGEAEGGGGGTRR
jgi:hypothetical protein